MPLKKLYPKQSAGIMVIAVIHVRIEYSMVEPDAAFAKCFVLIAFIIKKAAIAAIP